MTEEDMLNANRYNDLRVPLGMACNAATAGQQLQHFPDYRAKALEMALMHHGGQDVPAERIIETAKALEAYLKGLAA